MNITGTIFPRAGHDPNGNQGNADQFATELAQFHNWLGLKNEGKSLRASVQAHGNYIRKSYADINLYYYKTEDVIPAAEWYLDNFYLINELITDLSTDLTHKYESKLKYLAGGDLAGYPRIYVLVAEFIKYSDNDINVDKLKAFIERYQSEALLASAELWAIPLMLKTILLEKIFYQVERIRHIQDEREYADNWLNSILGRDKAGQGGREIALAQNELDSSKSFSPVYIERVARKLKDYGADAKVLLNWLDNVAGKQNMTVEKIIGSEHYYLTSHGVLMGNMIAAVKMINSEDWSAFYEAVSPVQKILNNDPAGVFNRMDFESRDKYRHEIENLAFKYNISELTVAQTIEKLALSSGDSPFNHVGYYLFGVGKVTTERELARNWGRIRQKFNGLACLFKEKPTWFYLGSIAGLTVIPFLIFVWLGWQAFMGAGAGVSVLAGVGAFIVINGTAAFFVNRIICNHLPPGFLPKLDLSGGIPDDCRTLVVIPAIFGSVDKVTEQMKQLEVHYLNNRTENVYFAVLGDFTDAYRKEMPGDDEIIRAGVNAVKKLNKKYGTQSFFYLHRERLWNEQDEIWMGWERKRGKLIELNKWLLNDGDTSYGVVAGAAERLKHIRYIITLDADTILPRDTAHRLIGTIAHPMQKARLDHTNTKVEYGYGIIQPRIAITAASAYATPFAQASTGIAGIDPYTCAISDIYQDLFGEGIFTGKGIYDLKVFHAVTKNAFPDNTILSHDLIEGLHARTALATDIQLFDGYPGKYPASAKRTHRWIRGDWQIARYLRDRKLAVVSRWKILDNLRRSLETPALLLLLFLGSTLLTQAFWLLFGLVLIILALPLILNIASGLITRSLTMRIFKHEVRVGLLQIIFALAVMPYQAYIQVDAIVRSVYRQLISKRALLEWEPAADSERKLELDALTFYRLMYKGLLVSVLFLVAIPYITAAQTAVLVWLVLTWLSSPYIAYRFSLPYAAQAKAPAQDDVLELRKWSRQIWAFFDLFVNRENHYLPPDNIQLEPYKGVAQRTSPTNIGLALLANLSAADLGYISLKTLVNRTRNTTDVLKKLPKWNGHIYNWYNTQTLEPLYPIYISTVDSGNLAGYMVALKNGLSDYMSKPVADKAMLQGLWDTVCLIDPNELDKHPRLISFRQELENLMNHLHERDLKSIYVFVSKWHDLLSPLSADVQAVKDRNIAAYDLHFWLAALTAMLHDSEQTIAYFYPYIKEDIAFDAWRGLENLGVKKLTRAYLALLKQHQRAARLERGDKHHYLYSGLKACVRTQLNLSRIRSDVGKLALNMDFKPLFDKQKRLFTIGYNLTEQKLDKSYYDLLASEARQTSLWAIAKGDVPEAHWFKMARPLTRIDGNRSLVSWSGTMFEFLMPLILFKNYRGTLLDESYQSVVKIQKAYAQKAGIPWGISESGFFSFDIQNNYQYKAFGVPGLGLKRGLAKDMVVSPYAAFMALAVNSADSIANLKDMKQRGFNGLYGLYEAIDFTSTRVPYNEKHSVVKSYMAHHQGMSFISLHNVLCGNTMQERFHREPLIRSVELLLQEQTPLKEYTFNPIIEETGDKTVPTNVRAKREEPVVFQAPDTKIPRPAFISNRAYSVMTTLSGSGYSQYNDIFVTRWRPDPTSDPYGSYIFIQNLNAGNMWSATSKPLNDPGQNYKVTCFPNSVKYSRQDGNIVTQTEIFVSPEDPVEIRKVALTNQSQHSRDIQLTSYAEIVLDKLQADVAHPAFSKLFIQTQYRDHTIVAHRRPRQHAQKEIYMMHTVVADAETLGEPEYETDRTKFIGRGRTLANPKAMDINQPLSNSAGAVLDPIASLRTRVRIEPGQTVNVCFLTGVADSSEAAMRLSEKYRTLPAINQAKELSWSQNLMELTILDLSFAEANIISGLAGQIIFHGAGRKRALKNNRKGQSALWAYGISGDLPIVLLKIQDSSQMKMVDQLLVVHEYWKIKGLFIDLVILNEDKTGYFQTIQENLHEKIAISHVRKLVNKPGGVFLLKKDQLPGEILVLLHTVARLVFSGENGSIPNQIQKFVKAAEQMVLPVRSRYKPLSAAQDPGGARQTETGSHAAEYRFYNGYGGFSQDGKEYVIQTRSDHTTPLPWVNVIANPVFGTLVTEAGSSYTWSQNSREYKLSPWSNDPLLDPSGEALYLRDEHSGCYWSPTPNPCQDGAPYLTRHGQGYTVFEHFSNGIQQETAIFVSQDKPVKMVRLKLQNRTHEIKTLSVYYYFEWVLGVIREQNAPYLVCEWHDDMITCRNVYQEEFAGRVSFLKAVGGILRSFTTDRTEFIGVNRNLREPAGLAADALSGKSGTGTDPCAVLQIGVELNPSEEKVIAFLIGDEHNEQAAIALARTCGDQAVLEKEYYEVRKYWNDLLSTIQISTPEPALDLLFNRWLLYQTLACRIWGRSAFYQSGGAFGYRDQLQDAMALTVVQPELTRRQIVLHSSRQFPEGDVQHWWHCETGKGIRTKFSDDLLWLPYVTADYLEHTGDYSVLEERTPFLSQELLAADEDERYFAPAVSSETADVYAHCTRAIDRSLRFGEHGLPLIGTGDWNDGFSAIGREGKGESVWLGWFILHLLERFIPVCEYRNDHERAGRYRQIMLELTENMERNAWDGAWYRRAYYDDGSPVGSVLSAECQIDSLAQSWSVLSGKARAGRARDGMLALERYLWDKDEGLLKLFTPPFDQTDKNPGYIKGYIPGVRENGGQYTHGAVWAVLALAKLGEHDKALELFNMLNPINHARTGSEVKKYKTEPYVMAADVYAVHPNIGRGGWTWYTGAAGWMYQAALEGILGFMVHGDKLTVTPAVPLNWDGFKISYRYKTSQYAIEIRFAANGELRIAADNETQQSFPLLLKDDGKPHTVKITIPRHQS